MGDYTYKTDNDYPYKTDNGWVSIRTKQTFEAHAMTSNGSLSRILSDPVTVPMSQYTSRSAD